MGGRTHSIAQGSEGDPATCGCTKTGGPSLQAQRLGLAVHQGSPTAAPLQEAEPPIHRAIQNRAADQQGSLSAGTPTTVPDSPHLPRVTSQAIHPIDCPMLQ
ncbi:hypothetical protein HF521_003972 [Silurus meridionalis]|uniref:Uncharacterized protein n=1 Tax=Silurus meridionalis TaxID=175797 RepID=A0A8T0AZW2_SILME|nr:hypothetical protein HF521_003972 [Silurus meridionalis]